MFKPGDVIKKHYEIKKELGHGGQVIVYLCEDTETKGQIVLKECIFKGLSRDDRGKELDLFAKEAEILKTITHPNLPKVYEFFNEGESHFIVEEFIDGTSLDKTLKCLGALPEEKVIMIGLQMTSILAHLHNNNPPVIIRDIKPANIITTEAGNLYFIDFTIARYAVKDKEDTVRMGSPGYAPPEQYRGLSTPQTDIYSLGVTFHQLLTGHDPLNSPFMLPPACSLKSNLSPDWDNIICKACELTPERRYNSAEELEKDLLALRKCLSDGPPAKGRRKGASPLQLPQLILRASLILLFIGACICAGFIVKGRYDSINFSACFQNITVMCNAIEAYADHYGTVPGSLDALTPEYLKTLPACPKSGFSSYMLNILDRKEEAAGSDLYETSTYKVYCNGLYHRSFFRDMIMPFKVVTHRRVIQESGTTEQNTGHSRYRERK
ncbi:MAG: serine/threonine protein kinase [Candidatus Xenobiia bacterium LiM19]